MCVCMYTCASMHIYMHVDEQMRMCTHVRMYPFSMIGADPHAHSSIYNHACRLTHAFPGCDLVAPTPRVEETKANLHAHRHLHACGDLPTALIFALTPERP